MKSSIFIILLFSSIISTAQTQYGIKGGLAYNHNKDVDVKMFQAIGYYGGFFVSKTVTEKVEAVGDFTFLDQRIWDSDEEISVKSLNGSFTFNLYPVNKFYAIVGFEMGLSRSTYQGEKVEGLDIGRLGGIGGLGYQISNDFRLEGRYISTINTQVFDRNFQIGVRYSF